MADYTAEAIQLAEIKGVHRLLDQPDCLYLVDKSVPKSRYHRSHVSVFALAVVPIKAFHHVRLYHPSPVDQNSRSQT